MRGRHAPAEWLVLALLLAFPTSLAAPGDCEARESFTQIHFNGALLAHSNLGGLGGRCDDNGDLCTEGATASSTPRDILIENVGLSVVGGSSAERIDLRITNQSECERTAVRELPKIARCSARDAFLVFDSRLERRPCVEHEAQWRETAARRA